MIRTLALLCICALFAFPATAGERGRLVPGKVDSAKAEFSRLIGGETHTELLHTRGFSLGAVSEAPASGGAERASFGGYASYGFDDLRLSSSLRSGAGTSMGEISASYPGLGGVAAVRLGYEWSGGVAFSPNPLQAGLNEMDAGLSGNDLSLSVSFSRDLTSALSLGGFAAASKAGSEERTPGSAFSLGAGLGLRF